MGADACEPATMNETRVPTSRVFDGTHAHASYPLGGPRE